MHSYFRSCLFIFFKHLLFLRDCEALQKTLDDYFCNVVATATYVPKINMQKFLPYVCRWRGDKWFVSQIVRLNKKKLEMFARKIYVENLNNNKQTFQHLMYLKHWSAFMWIFELYCFTVDMQALWNKYLCTISKSYVKQSEHKWNTNKKVTFWWMMVKMCIVYEFKNCFKNCF